MIKIVLVLLVSLLNLSICNACEGCLDLDELTFDKTVTKFKTALVKFDQSFPYGNTHEKFAEFAQQINNRTLSEKDHTDVLIATVGIKDYGDNENKKLGNRYGISADKLPAIKLFIDGDLDTPIDFKIGSDPLSITQLFTFIKEHSKVLILAPGCDEKFDKLADDFMKNQKMRNELMKEAEAAIEKVECEKKKQIIKFYLALMKGVIEKGDEFIGIQKDRMGNLLKGKITKTKQEEIHKKLNILSSFKTVKRNVAAVVKEDL